MTVLRSAPPARSQEALVWRTSCQRRSKSSPVAATAGSQTLARKVDDPRAVLPEALTMGGVAPGRATGSAS
jgi:hypothetical protein